MAEYSFSGQCRTGTQRLRHGEYSGAEIGTRRRGSGVSVEQGLFDWRFGGGRAEARARKRLAKHESGKNGTGTRGVSAGGL